MFLGFLHQLFIAGEVDGHAALFGHDAGEVDGEAVGVVEFEGDLRREMHDAFASWIRDPGAESEQAFFEQSCDAASPSVFDRKARLLRP